MKHSNFIHWTPEEISNLFDKIKDARQQIPDTKEEKQKSVSDTADFRSLSYKVRD